MVVLEAETVPSGEVIYENMRIACIGMYTSCYCIYLVLYLLNLLHLYCIYLVLYPLYLHILS
jgi:hypothetical protein